MVYGTTATLLCRPVDARLSWLHLRAEHDVEGSLLKGLFL
jgi:hypothetical protein